MQSAECSSIYICDAMEMSWEKILGHEACIARLRKLLKEKKLPHALLFSGAAGIGKRLVAEALASALLCGTEDCPCGSCAGCAAMRAGTHPDFFVVEPSAGKGSKMIKIEQIREVQNEIARLPLLSRCRVVIVDDADCMNDAAQNALLKTLEEPAGQVFFLLVTSRKSGLLDTILSRTMQMEFGPLPLDILASELVRRGMPKEQVRGMAALAEGSLGRALRLYEEDGLSMRDDALAMLERIVSPEKPDMEALWRKAEEMSAQSREHVQEWIGCFHLLLRDVLILHAGGTRIVNEDVRRRVAALLTAVPQDAALRMERLASRMERRMLANVNLRLQLEAFWIKEKFLCRR